MQVERIHGDVIEATGQGEALAHGVNMQGVTGGFAGVMAREFPVNHENYLGAVQTDILDPGSCLVLFEKGRVIFNLVTQFEPGPNANLHMIREGMKKAVIWGQRLNLSHINLPEIGCGIGGLTWPDVRATLESIDSPLEARVYILDKDNV